MRDGASPNTRRSVRSASSSLIVAPVGAALTLAYDPAQITVYPGQ